MVGSVQHIVLYYSYIISCSVNIQDVHACYNATILYSTLMNSIDAYY